MYTYIHTYIHLVNRSTFAEVMIIIRSQVYCFFFDSQFICCGQVEYSLSVCDEAVVNLSK